jgi:xanthine/CO dehydrogenase XdhC/CoxF family maturation factor
MLGPLQTSFCTSNIVIVIAAKGMAAREAGRQLLVLAKTVPSIF